MKSLSINDKWYLKRGKPQKVLILGAGMAGMAAGIELIKLGHDVKIIEGQTRAGGRVETIRIPSKENLYANLGASRIPGNHEWTMKYINQYNLQLHPFNPLEGEYIHMFNGKRIRYTYDQPADFSNYPVELTQKELAMGWQRIFSTPLKNLIINMGDPKSLAWPPEKISKYDIYSFKEYLDLAGYSRSISDLINIGWETEQGMDMSILQFMRTSILSYGAIKYKIVGGSDLLPMKMAEDLAKNIQYGTKVIDLYQDEKKVSVIVSGRTERQTLTADRVICALPLTVIRKMNFVKFLSKEKQKAIREMTYWNLSKTILQVSNRYWKKEGLNGFAATNRPMEVWDPNYESSEKRGLIVAYMKDDDSRLMTKLSDQERLNFVSNQVNKVFPNLFDHLEHSYTKNWGEDPWALGGYSINTRGQMTTLLPHLIKPEGRIYFAGEHASAYHGWIQGAIESGNRAAKEINSFE
ncbi:MAG: amine oxidase [Saprospiraceae bacterium]|nr:MAG: amine oxidase [Saprospiraceae bacterium]